MTARIDPFDIAVGAALRGLQGTKDVTNLYIAAETGIHPRTLIRILKGQRPATLGEVRLLAAALGTTAAEVASIAESLVEDH